MDLGFQALRLLVSGQSRVEDLAAAAGVSISEAATTLLKLVAQGEAEGSIPTLAIERIVFAVPETDRFEMAERALGRT